MFNPNQEENVQKAHNLGIWSDHLTVECLANLPFWTLESTVINGWLIPYGSVGVQKELSAYTFSLRLKLDQTLNPLQKKKTHITWVWVKNRYPKWTPRQMETWTKTCGPIPGGLILTHTHRLLMGEHWPRPKTGGPRPIGVSVASANQSHEGVNRDPDAVNT